MNLRDAKLEDVEALTVLAEEFWSISDFSGLPFVPERVRSYLKEVIQAPHWLVVVAEDETGLHGAVLGHLEPMPFNHEVVLLEDYLFMSPSHQGLRIGIQLMHALEGWGNVMGAKQIHFAPSAMGYDARWDKFTQHLGYERTGIHYMKTLGVTKTQVGTMKTGLNDIVTKEAETA